jgi:diguanylate cyclase (GGDEF)-like protein
LSARKRSEWSVVSPGRLAEIIERMSAERRPERMAPSALAAALAATGARGGRLVGPTPSGRRELLAADGEEGEGALRICVDLPGPDGPLGRIEVWDAPDEGEAESALRLVAAVCARALENLCIERERADERTRARRLGAAASAIRGTGDPQDAVTRVLAEVRALVAAPAAVLMAAGAPSPEVAAYDGIDPLSPSDLAELVPEEVRAELSAGRAWNGPLAPGSSLRAHGFAGVALVGVGPRAGLGVLAVLGASDEPLASADLEALVELAGHAGAALTMSVLQQEIRDLGAVDPTTHFYNARYFQSRLQQECERALRAGVPVSVAIVSLDGLAQMRAEGRSVAAESAVEALSRHVAARLRTMDVGCRVGVDELAAILPEVEGLDALRVGERLRATVGSVAGLDGRFTLSVGVASFPSQAGRPQSLEDNARAALDWARAHGGDRTFLFHAETAAILRSEGTEDGNDDEAVLTTVAALAAGIDARHPSTVFHSENVGRIAALVAAEVGLPLDRVEDVRVAGLLHDVGKIGVSDGVVVATEPLTPAQEGELRRHPEIGERMLAGSRLASIAPWVLHHHERFDGGGYPAGLSGEQIPLEARILAVANVFDRLASGGPARFPMPVADVMTELERRSGSELDPVAVAALRALVGRGAADITPRFG